MKNILWWGRYDPDYSRNRILRSVQKDLGFKIIDFHPRSNLTSTLEIKFKDIEKPDIIWVPCFRQRDIKSASKWAKTHKIPLIFDPLISAWDKQVFERKKYDPNSRKANKLLRNETMQFQLADRLVADTEEHAHFFSKQFNVNLSNIMVIPVGAEESLFKPAPFEASRTSATEVLFYGSFISLQGPQTIIEAARTCNQSNIKWFLLGNGPMLDECKKLAMDLNNVAFEDWIDYKELPTRIHKADILLGIFGSSDKASRVIPNKVYQALACARPVITRSSPAYPVAIHENQGSGIRLIPENDPLALCESVKLLSQNREKLEILGKNARIQYENYFSMTKIRNRIKALLKSVGVEK